MAGIPLYAILRELDRRHISFGNIETKKSLEFNIASTKDYIKWLENIKRSAFGNGWGVVPPTSKRKKIIQELKAKAAREISSREATDKVLKMLQSADIYDRDAYGFGLAIDKNISIAKDELRRLEREYQAM